MSRGLASSGEAMRSSGATDANGSDGGNLSGAAVARRPAEVLFDAVAQATAGSAELARAATDVEERAIGPKGGALIGRRDYGDYASKVFGRSTRDANCDCSASIDPNLLQAIFIQNDQETLTATHPNNAWLH